MFKGILRSYYNTKHCKGNNLHRSLKINSGEKERKDIAQNGHRLRDMAVGTSGHEDDQWPCRLRMRYADDCARFAGRREGVRFVKTAEDNFSQAQVDFDVPCV